MLAIASCALCASPQTKAPICVELSPDNLQSLYETLEKIQGQLDVLSDKPV